MALSEENLEDVILSEKRDDWNAMLLGDCTDTFTANATDNFFPRMCCNTNKKHNKSEPGVFREEFRCTGMLCLCGKTFCCCDRKSNKYKFSCKSLNKRTPEDCGDGPMSKYSKVPGESVNVTSTNRDFEHINMVWRLMNKPRKNCPIFTPKRNVEYDGIHSKPLPFVKLSLKDSVFFFIHSYYIFNTLYQSFYLDLNQNSICKRNKKPQALYSTAGVIIRQRRNIYPRVRGCMKKSVYISFFPKSLTVLKMSHSAHSLSLYFAKPYSLY